MAFHIRVRANGKREPVTLHERAGCDCGCGGGWDEPAARTEMGNMLARIRAGVWERPAPPPTLLPTQDDGEIPGYAAYSDWWLGAKKKGLIGDGPISDNTEKDYAWRIGPSYAFFGETPVDEIDARRALAFKEHLLDEAAALREQIAAGAELRDEYGRQLVPLSLASIKKAIEAFASIMDEAVEDGHREDNPARSRRMRIKAPKPKRSFLEMDELAALLDAARDRDLALPAVAAAEKGSTAERIGRLAAQGRKPIQIAAELGLAKSTVSYHLGRIGIKVGRGYIGRRVICEILGRAGLRVSELCDLKIADVRLHGPEGVYIRIVDAKTEAGERVVQATPELGEVIVEHIDRIRREGRPTGPADYLIPNTRDGRISRQRVAAIVREAATLASERLVERGLSPLPKTTPHTLRRTYISIALIANKFDVKWVMDQVGHADSKMTMDVYAQLQKRYKRRHGGEFDRLVRTAREQLAGAFAAV